ncbi:MAG: hypothetical protein P9L99_07630 [Candidatus Lernaella stagnicola]|nr:hypothetical protein [Candidatus Lernaella stagnicola]
MRTIGCLCLTAGLLLIVSFCLDFDVGFAFVETLQAELATLEAENAELATDLTGEP